MKKILFIGVILLILITCIMAIFVECSTSTFLSGGKISGIVKVYWPSEKVFKPGRARIDILNTELYTISSFYGNYFINNIPEGQYTITVSKYGYVPVQKTIDNSKG